MKNQEEFNKRLLSLLKEFDIPFDDNNTNIVINIDNDKVSNISFNQSFDFETAEHKLGRICFKEICGLKIPLIVDEAVINNLTDYSIRKLTAKFFNALEPVMEELSKDYTFHLNKHNEVVFTDIHSGSTTNGTFILYFSADSKEEKFILSFKCSLVYIFENEIANYLEDALSFKLKHIIRATQFMEN